VTGGSAGRCPTCGAPFRPAAFFLDPLHEHDPYAQEEPASTSIAREPPEKPAPPDRRRRIVVAGAVAATIVLVWAAVARSGGSEEDARATQPIATSTTRGPTTTTSSTTTTLVLGKLLPEPTGIQLLVFQPDRTLRVDLDTGRVETVGPSMSEVHTSLVVGGRLVVAGGDGLWIHPPDFSVPGERLRPGADAIFPSAYTDRFWVLSWQTPGPVLEELGVQGGVHTRISIPPYTALRDVTRHGVLLDLGGKSFLLNPYTGQSRELEGLVLAISNGRAARLACEEDLTCGVEIGPIDGPGERLLVELPDNARVEPWDAEFSPDGTVFAVQIAQDPPLGGSLQMGLFDAASGGFLLATRMDGPTPVVWGGDWAFLVEASGVHALHESGAPHLELPIDGASRHVAVIPAPSEA
jgi:hypothetical protein